MVRNQEDELVEVCMECGEVYDGFMDAVLNGGECGPFDKRERGEIRAE